MTHEEWVAELDSILHDETLVTTSRIAALEALLASTATLAKAGIGDWHVHQVTSAIAMAHEDCGNTLDAANVYAQSAEDLESQMRSLEVAIGCAFASAAMLQFVLVQNEQAVVTAKRAFQYFGRTADPSPIYGDLITRLRSFLEENRG